MKKILLLHFPHLLNLFRRDMIYFFFIHLNWKQVSKRKFILRDIGSSCISIFRIKKQRRAIIFIPFTTFLSLLLFFSNCNWLPKEMLRLTFLLLYSTIVIDLSLTRRCLKEENLLPTIEVLSTSSNQSDLARFLTWLFLCW